MNKTSKRIVLVLGGVALATTLVAGGRHYFGDPEYRADWMVHKITEELELTDAQQTKLKNVRDLMMEARKQVHDGHEGRRETVLTLLSQPQLDRQKVLTLINERTEAVREQAPRIVDAAGQFYDSLTAEQHEVLREHVAEKMERHHFGGRG